MPWKNPEFWMNIPFIGAVVQKDSAPRLSRSLLEYLVMACVPIFIGAIWVVPQLETQAKTTREIVAELKIDIKRNTEVINNLSTNIAKVDQSTEFVKEIANTKVRSVEGRLDGVEARIKALEDEIKAQIIKHKTYDIQRK